MKRPKYRIEIHRPCHEDWAQMTPTERGRFCANCQKQVVDFTAYSDRELVKHIQKSNEKLCGRYRKDQLNRDLEGESPKVKNNPLYVLFSSMLAAASLTPLISNGQRVNVKVAVIKTPEKQKDRQIKLRNYSPKDSNDFVIQGLVVDSLGRPMSGITVFLKDTRLVTLTDKNGLFELKIAPEIINNKLVLVTYGQGYKEFQYKVNKRKLPISVKIALQSNGKDIDDDLIMGVVGDISGY